MAANIAVIYLARLTEPFSAFEAFAESYRRYEAGIEHDVFLLIKGAVKPGYMASLGSLFSEIPFTSITVPDDVGYAPHAYEYALPQIPHEYIVFLNTFSRIAADEWLKKMYDNLTLSGVGIVGATASFESHHNSCRLRQQLAWHKEHSAMPLSLQRKFAFILGQPPTRFFARLKRWAGHIRHRRPDMSISTTECFRWWREQTSHGNEYDFVWNFPVFPNPHIRTNAFMIRRKDMLEHGFPAGKTKIDCYEFESGHQGLTVSLRRQGLRPLLVGADGKGFELHEWPDSGCYRSGAQQNLLIMDKQTETFSTLSDGEKESLSIMTWGGYRQGISGDIAIHGTPFSGKYDLSGFVPWNLHSVSEGSRLFSIVIPCRNRGNLAMQVVQMVQRQDYQNWEICLFDNASETPLAEMLSGVDDPRIKLKRSDNFLPVTESWNSAFAMAEGDYVTMIGDDDGIFPGFFSRLNALIDHFGNPELIISDMLQFIYPGVMPAIHCGYIARLFLADFLDCEPYPFILDGEEAERSVDNALKLQRSFYCNMPAYTASRSLLKKMERDGKILHSPFPDYYYANIALSSSTKTVCEPKPLSFQGVSRVSFGFNLINSRLDKGFILLGKGKTDSITASIAGLLLPGNPYQSENITTMAYVADFLNDPSRKPDISKYRRMQILNIIKNNKQQGLYNLWSKLTLRERIWTLYVCTIIMLYNKFNLFKTNREKLNIKISPYSHFINAGTTVINKGNCCDGLDVFKYVKSCL